MDRMILALAAAFPAVSPQGDATAHARPGHSLNVHGERPTGMA